MPENGCGIWKEMDIPSVNVNRPTLLQKGNSLNDILADVYKEDVVTHITLKSEKSVIDLRLKHVLGSKCHCLFIGKRIAVVFGIPAPVDDEKFGFDAIIITKARPPFVLTVVKKESDELLRHNRALANKVRKGFTYFSTENLTTVNGVLLSSAIQHKDQFETFMDSCKEDLVDTIIDDKLYMDEHKRDDAIRALITRMSFQETKEESLHCLTFEEFKYKYHIKQKHEVA